MAFITKSVKVLRNNWKKSTFLAVVVTWGTSYTKNYIKTQQLMTAYCKDAAQFGKESIAVTVQPRHITVILNPSANKRKAQTEFEKYCAPLLYLAGVSVEIVKTESEGHAKELINTINEADAIVVAGGDGTLSEVITGLLRRTNENTSGLVPVGILPLGKHNTVGNFLFPGDSKLEKVKSLADATMAVIENVTKPMDVMRIDILNDESKKPVYAVSGIKWGAYRDAEVKKESYWYFFGLKKYATYLFSGLKSSLSWQCQAQVLYSPPCTGCSNCFKVSNSQPKSRWFQSFMKGNEEELKVTRVSNPHCEQKLEKNISTSDLLLFTSNVIPSRIEDSTVPKLNLKIGPDHIDYIDFVKQGWKSEQGETRDVQESIEARVIEINPESQGKRELWFSIDNENYEVKPIRVTLLPKIIKMFCKTEAII